MLYNSVINVPKDPREIFEYAKSKSFHSWIDEKGTKDHPDIWQRKLSTLTYEEATTIIQNNKPHWVILYRDMTYLTGGREPSYWEFGGCNLKSNDYGEVFVWVQVSHEESMKIFKKFGLEISEIYSKV